MTCSSPPTGSLFTFLARLPRQRWTERDPTGWTFLHLACRQGDIRAMVLLLKSGTVDKKAVDDEQWSVVHAAARADNELALQALLVAGGFDMCSRQGTELSPLDLALDCPPSAALLIRNGVRLRCISDPRDVEPWMVALESGRLLCRSVVVTLLGLRRRGQILRRVDRFLMRADVALAIWCTRSDAAWAYKHAEKDAAGSP